MAEIRIDIQRCKGCGICIESCPHKLIVLSRDFSPQGLHYAVYQPDGECTGCALCAMMCPDVAIEVWK